jgi:hypothetical protein
VRDSYREFFCGECEDVVRTCTECDRGQQYCPEHSFALRSLEAMRAAGRRYAQTPDGKWHAARRQARRRKRLRLRVLAAFLQLLMLLAELKAGDESLRGCTPSGTDLPPPCSATDSDSPRPGSIGAGGPCVPRVGNAGEHHHQPSSGTTSPVASDPAPESKAELHGLRIVTHTGSDLATPTSKITIEDVHRVLASGAGRSSGAKSQDQEPEPHQPGSDFVRCSFCGRWCGPLTRFGFLGRSQPVLRRKPG